MVSKDLAQSGRVVNDVFPGKKHISFSQISMFLRCPKQYEFRYIQGLRKPPSGAMVLGRVWHEGIEKNYRQKIETKQDLPLDEMQDFFAEKFDNTFYEEEISLTKYESAPKLKDQGVSIVTTHHKEIAPTVDPLLVEEKFNLYLGDDFPFYLFGIWDLIDTDGFIVDNKSYKRVPKQLDLDKDLQFTAYSLAYRANMKKIEAGIRMDAVIKKKQPEAVQLYTKRTNTQCEFFIELVENVGRAIKAEHFYPNPNGFLCSPDWCGFWDRCMGK